MGMAFEGLLGFGAFLLESWLMDILYSSEPLNALLLIFCTQSRVQTGWLVFYKHKDQLLCITDHITLAPQVI